MAATKKKAPAVARAIKTSERKTSESKGTKNQRLDKILTDNLGAFLSVSEAETMLLLQKYVTIFSIGFIKALSDGKVLHKRVSIMDLRRICDRTEIIIADGTYCHTDTNEVKMCKEAWRV